MTDAPRRAAARPSALLMLFILAALFVTAASARPARASDRFTAVAVRTTGPVVVDGILSEPCWRALERSPAFVDMVGGDPAWFETRAALAWDDAALYVAYRIAEPDVRAALTRRDARIYTENDVELFIDGGDAYYELELNARGTIYEVFWIWDDAKDRPCFRKPEFDAARHPTLKLRGIGPHVHPRGMRTGYLDWDLPGLRWAVRVRGTLNDARDRDQGWDVELALPWRALTLPADGRTLPPEPGDCWRMDFSRFEHVDADGRPLSPPAGWSWTPHGVFDSHMPERFTRVRFATTTDERNHALCPDVP